MKKAKRLICLAVVIATVLSMWGCKPKMVAEVTEEASFAEEASEETVFAFGKEPTVQETTEEFSEPEEETTTEAGPDLMEDVTVDAPADTTSTQEPHKHTYTKTVIKEATCISSGEVFCTCSCGDSYSEELAKKQHDYASRIVLATCIKEGYTLYDCRNCDATYKDDYIKAKGHDWEEWQVTKESTIMATGTKVRACSVCKQKETAIIEKIPHTHTHDEEVTTKPACEKKGVKSFNCVCGDSYTEEILLQDISGVIGAFRRRPQSLLRKVKSVPAQLVAKRNIRRSQN